MSSAPSPSSSSSTSTPSQASPGTYLLLSASGQDGIWASGKTRMRLGDLFGSVAFETVPLLRAVFVLVVSGPELCALEVDCELLHALSVVPTSCC